VYGERTCHYVDAYNRSSLHSIITSCLLLLIAQILITEKEAARLVFKH